MLRARRTGPSLNRPPHPRSPAHTTSDPLQYQVRLKQLEYFVNTPKITILNIQGDICKNTCFNVVKIIHLNKNPWQLQKSEPLSIASALKKDPQFLIVNLCLFAGKFTSS